MGSEEEKMRHPARSISLSHSAADSNAWKTSPNHIETTKTSRVITTWKTETVFWMCLDFTTTKLILQTGAEIRLMDPIQNEVCAKVFLLACN